MHTGAGYYRKAPSSEIEEFRNHVNELENRLANAKDYLKELEVKAAEKRRKIQERKAAKEREAMIFMRDQLREARGRRYDINALNRGWSNTAASWFRNDNTKSVAIADCGFVALFDDETRWQVQGSVPLGLINKLKGRSMKLSKPTYVCLNPFDSSEYFLRFENGSFSGCMPDQMFEDIGDEQEKPKRVAFASGDGYVVLFGSGRTMWRNISRSLESHLRSNQKSIKEIAIDSDEEWVIVYEDFSTSVSRFCSIRDEIKSLESRGNVIKSVIFGSHGSYVIRYS